MKFTTPVNIKLNKTIDYNSRIVMLGSCFAENIGKKLIDCGFNVVMNPMGILYNPISIFSALERIVEGREFTEDELFCHNGLWTSFMHHGCGVVLLRTRICCQNPTLNPAQLVSAIEKYLPEYVPDFSKCSRVEIYDANEEIFR